MNQLAAKGILVCKKCRHCPEFRQPQSRVRPDTSVCVECEVPTNRELGEWTVKYYKS